MPPLKKYVTWAYFSVSATWNWRQPASLKRLGERSGRLGRERDEDRQALLVLRHRHDEQVASEPVDRWATSVEGVEPVPSASAWVSWRARSARKFRWTTGVAGRRPGRSSASTTVGATNSSVSPRS